MFIYQYQSQGEHWKKPKNTQIGLNGYLRNLLQNLKGGEFIPTFSLDK